jgi:translocation and assembly module TamB
MAERHTDDGPAVADERIVVRRSRTGRLAALAALALLILMLVAVAGVWIERRPIASNFLEREFDRRGVQATYHLDRVGLRTQQVSNLVIGDPAKPDLVARLAQVQVRLKWNGTVEVYRIVARGVRLRGRFVHGKVSWGQIDKLLPPPSGKPFQLPDFVLDVADSTISLSTPFGPLGVALQGNGRLSGGFKGRAALASPILIPGKCLATNVHANVLVEVVARRPHIAGPLTLDRLACPRSRFEIVSPRFDLNSHTNESFTAFDGNGRMAIQTLTAGGNGLAAFVGDLSFNGTPQSIAGEVKLAAQRSRLAAIFAERTRLAGKYRLGLAGGTMVMVGDYATQGATLAPSMLASLTGPLAAARGTPIGPVATAIGDAMARTARQFDASGKLRMVNFPGGGAVRIETADARGPAGARVLVSGGDGVNYYWPTGRIRIDGRIQMGGGGLPRGDIALSQPRSGAPMSGIANFAPYAAGGSRLALAPVRFAAGRDGSTQVSTIALLDGPFPNGRVRALRVPISGRLGTGGSLAVGAACAELSFASLQTGSLQLGPTRLPVCPVGSAIVSKTAGGPLRVGARFARPVLNGRLGQSPFHLAAAGGQFVDKNFAMNALALRLGRAESPVIFDAGRLNGTFVGSGISGTFGNARATIGNVPLAMSEVAGRWRSYKGDLTVNGGLMMADRSPTPRFYPLRSDDVRFTLGGGYVRANGTLKHPASGTRVTDVSIVHELASGRGHADLNVPGITFGEGLQPEELTRLTEGVVALVTGTVTGHGRIDWTGNKVSSTGDFSTAGLDLAAPFGPVTGMRGTMHFTDLLGLTTAPGQTMAIASVNPGILVENGVVHYQLLPGQLVRVERGEWPFMGGRLILRETILNFSRPTAKRLTFEVVGLDAHAFVASMGFKEIDAIGVFDGVLPMIFDENGGRIVGGRLDARAPGGSLSYNGVVNRANLGLMAKVAFDALQNLKFKSMIIRLDGDLAGEFATRLTIEGVGLGDTGTAKLIRSITRKLPLKFNVSIKGPFRALIATAKSYRDPRQQISDVLPLPLDSVPGIVTEVRRSDENQTQTQTPVGPTIELTPTSPPPSEKRP